MKILQSPTAIENYYHHVIPYVAQPQQQRILDVMTQGRSYTIGELAQITGMDKSAVSGTVRGWRCAQHIAK